MPQIEAVTVLCNASGVKIIDKVENRAARKKIIKIGLQ